MIETSKPKYRTLPLQVTDGDMQKLVDAQRIIEVSDDDVAVDDAYQIVDGIIEEIMQSIVYAWEKEVAKDEAV